MSALLTVWTRKFAGGSMEWMQTILAGTTSGTHLKILGEEDRSNCEKAENYSEKIAHILFVES
jgi:hypothetical protein